MSREPARHVRILRAWLIAGFIPLSLTFGWLLWPITPSQLVPDEVVSQRFFDRFGVPLAERLSREDGRSLRLPVDEPLPARVVDAFVAVEDRRFYSHSGVDGLALLRAARNNLAAFRITSGASTLTMQLAREASHAKRNWFGKIEQALWAWRIEWHLSKDEILRTHLNRVPLSHQVFGVEAAARYYFGKPASRLTDAQAAALVAIAQAPSARDPIRRAHAVESATKRVLHRWLPAGERLQAALSESLEWNQLKIRNRAPHFVAAVGSQTNERDVRTTLDAVLQADIEEMVRDELQALSVRHLSQAAVVVLDNASGDVLAWIGSGDFYGEDGQNDGVLALRQPGSTLKPFVYGTLLEQGASPATLFFDVSTEFATDEGNYVPHNYDRRSHGPVRLRAALANSYNVPAVQAAERAGPERVLKTLHEAGFTSLSQSAEHYGVGLALGNGDVTLLELANAYRGLANGGVFRPTTCLLGSPGDGRGRRFLPQNVSALLADILSDDVSRAPAFGRDSALSLPFPTAVKTGTSRAYVDNWTVGFTYQRTVAVWAGNFDGSPMQYVSGVTGAGPLFNRVMRRTMQGLEPAALLDPRVFAFAEICALSGKRATQHCPHPFTEKFLPRTAPSQPCDMHGPDGVLDLPKALTPWAQEQHLAHRAQQSKLGAARLMSPQDGDEYMIEPGVPKASQSIPLRVAAPKGAWLVADGRRLNVPVGRGELVASEGDHVLELWTEDGLQERARYRVVH